MKIALTLAVALLLGIAPAAARAQGPPAGDPDEASDRPFPKIGFAVNVTEEKDKASGDMVRVIVGSGTTEYPPGASLILDARMVGSSAYLDKAHQVFVDEQGHWQAAIDDLGRNIYKGQYEVRVTFDPTFQGKGILSKVSTKFNPALQSQRIEIHIGTPEEEAVEKIDVDQYYARSFARAKDLCEKTFKEYEKQSPAPDRRAWGDFSTDTNDALVNADHDLAEFKKLRDNLRDYKTYELIRQVYAVSTSRLFPVLNAALGIEGGKAKPEEKADAKLMMDQLKAVIAELDQTVGKVVIDPKWVMMKPLVPMINKQPPPPVGPILPEPEVNVQPRPRPIGDSGRSKFGIVELGIGLAIMCGLAMLAILLKRK